jgi:hypothetical protein
MQHPPAVNFPVKATEAPKKTDAKRPFSMYAPSFQPSGEDIVNNEVRSVEVWLAMVQLVTNFSGHFPCLEHFNQF